MPASIDAARTPGHRLYIVDLVQIDTLIVLFSGKENPNTLNSVITRRLDANCSDFLYLELP